MSSSIVGDHTEFPHLIAIGASAGGIEPLLTVVEGLPPDLPACVLIVVHVPGSGPSALPRVIGRVTTMPVAHAADRDSLKAGHVLIAPPDHHLMVKDHSVAVRRGPAVNRSRPAIDPLFQSVALHAGPRGMGIVLSGALDDGAAGLAAIGSAGGTTIVQEPGEAMYPSMPEAALRAATVQHRLPAELIAATVVSRVNSPTPSTNGRPVAAKRLAKELMMNEMDEAFVTSDELGTDTSVFGCPACGGTLWELREGQGFRFRCRVGHAYSPQTLLAAQGTNGEDGLWVAVRALDEQASLARRLADQARDAGQETSERRFRQQAESAERHAATVRDLMRAEPGILEPIDAAKAAEPEAPEAPEAAIP